MPTAAPAPVANGCAAPDVTAEANAAPAVIDRVDGCFEPGGAHDVYRFVVPGEGRMALTFTITGAPDRVSTIVHFVAPGGQRLVKGPATAQIRGTDRAQLIAESGTTLLLDASPNVEPADAQPWSIAIAATPVAGEPDDEPRPLPLETPHAGAIEPWLSRTGEAMHDVDRYAIDVTTAGTLSVRVDEPAHTLRPKLTIRDDRGKTIAAPPPPGVPKTVEATASVTPGRYTIELVNVGGYKPFVLSTDDTPVALGYRIAASVKR